MTPRRLWPFLVGTLILAAFPTAAASAGAVELQASRVQTIVTSAWAPASPDPSGLAYIGEDLDRLVAVDGEVEEITGAGFHDVNAWFAERVGGGATGALNTRTASPANSEPVGAAYDAARDELYVAQDGSSSRVWVYSRSGSSFAQTRYFTVYGYGIGDAEGLAFGNGALYVADGLNSEIWTISPGPNGVVGTGGDDEIRHFDTAALGISDPEGIGFHPVTNTLWVASRRANEGLIEVTLSGVAVSHASYDFAPVSPAGVEVAPSSVNPQALSIWVAARGVDNGIDPTENDGRIYELALREAAGASPGDGENLLVNGGFEQASGTGLPTGWSTDSRFTQSASDAHSGQNSGRHQAATDSGYKIVQTVPISGGKSYAFTGWVNAPATMDAFKLTFKLQWRSSSGAISTITLGGVTRSTGGWVAVSSTQPSPSTATTARMMMVVTSLNTTVYVDDLVLAGAP